MHLLDIWQVLGTPQLAEITTAVSIAISLILSARGQAQKGQQRQIIKKSRNSLYRYHLLHRVSHRCQPPATHPGATDHIGQSDTDTACPAIHVRTLQKVVAHPNERR